MRALALIPALILMSPGATRAAGNSLPPMPSPTETKVELERKIVAEISEILDRFLGPGRSHVTVFLNVAIKAPPENQDAGKNDRFKKKPKKVEQHWTWREISKKPRMSVLPGFAINPDVSVTDNKKGEPIKPPVSEEADDADDSQAFILEVKQMLVSIVLDSSVSEKNQKMIEIMVSEVLGLDPDRGDHLNIYKLPMQPAWKWALGTPETTVRIFWGTLAVLTSALLLFFIARALQAVLRARAHAHELPKEKPKAAHADAKADAKAGAGANAPGSNGAGGGKTDADISESEEDSVLLQRLDFVSTENFEMLSELLKDSDPKEIACVLGFVDTALCGRILDRLPQNKRLEALMYLVSAASISPQEMTEIKRTWRERLALAYGGTSMVGELLSTMHPALQKTFLDRLKVVSPDLAPKVSEALVVLGDIGRLEHADLAQLAQSVPFEDWAKALAPLPQGYKDRVLSVLPDSSRQVLQQWLSLTKPRKLESEQAQAKVLSTMRSLLRQGKIVLSREPVPMPAPPAAAPAGGVPAPAAGAKPAAAPVAAGGPPSSAPGPRPSVPTSAPPRP